MISLVIRRIATEIQLKTGRSVQEIIEEVVAVARGGMVAFTSPMVCAFCASSDTEIKKTERKDSSIKRRHVCRFCGRSFFSTEEVKTEPPENKLSPGIDELRQPLAKTPKKRKAKDRKT